MKRIILIFLAPLLFIYCSKTEKSSLEILVLNIEQALNNFQISSLSEFSTTIRYVPLETTDSSLVTNQIRNVYVENDKVFVMDDDPFLKVFSAQTGEYLYNIGKKGQGPGELPHLASVDINASENIILLCLRNTVHCFDFEGNFIRKINLPDLDGDVEAYEPVVWLDEKKYASVIRPVENQENLLILFDDEQQLMGELKCYDNPVQPDIASIRVWSSDYQGGRFYRTDKSVHYYRGFTDTVFTYNPEENMFSPHFIINYGKHKSTLDFNPGKENSDLIMISSINENEEYIFLAFSTTKASPQPYKDLFFREGEFFEFINQSIFGVYDKKEESLHFLLQSIPGIPGLNNDLDRGIPFYIRKVSSTGQLIDYYQSYKFLELAENIPNADDTFVQIAKQVSDDDNPIIIIAE